MNTLLILGIFTGLKAKIGGGILSLILGIGFIKNWAKIADKVAKFVAKWSGEIYVYIQEHGDVFLKIENTANKIDDAIDDNGKTDLSTLKEAIELGKQVKVELDDMIVVFKPKK
jgi:hypothetical protein